jgi:heat shock protein HslJ
MFKKSNFFLTILILILGLALNSFSSTKGLETASNNQVLKNTKWELKSLNKKDIKKVEKVAIINFEKENKVFGNLGCNSFFGTYKSNKNSLEIGQVGSTMMMCQNMQTEQDFAKVLQDVKTYKIDKNSLVFFDENSKEIAKFRN